MPRRSDGSRSYDEVPDIGALYDHIPVYVSRQDVPFYVEMAKAAGGPVLELGCGTGRILLPTARAGVTITGLDRAGGMLGRCREKLAAESADVRARVDLVEADMRAFELGRAFKLVTIPFRAFQHLVTIADQLATLEAIRKHLALGGRLAFDLFNPNFAMLVSPRTEEQEDTPRTALPDGRWLRRTARVPSVDLIAQVSQVELIYYVTDASGREDRHVQAFPMRWFLRAEVEHLLARAGFRVIDIFGDMTRSALTATSPDIVVVAEAG